MKEIKWFLFVIVYATAIIVAGSVVEWPPAAEYVPQQNFKMRTK